MRTANLLAPNVWRCFERSFSPCTRLGTYYSCHFVAHGEPVRQLNRHRNYIRSFPALHELCARIEMAPSAFVPVLGKASSFTGRHVRAVSHCGAISSRHATAAKRRISPTMKVYDVEIFLQGETHNIPIDENDTLLEGIEQFGLTVPYSCRAGVCMTCAAKIETGNVDLGEIAMMDSLKDEGYVLTCSGMPRGEGIKLTMEMDVYEKQYGQYEAEN